MTAALAIVSSAAVASPDNADLTVEKSQAPQAPAPTIPQPTDLKIPRLTDVIGALLFYAFYKWTG
jgi:hypothetical protein